jgi:hypothetical protein
LHADFSGELSLIPGNYYRKRKYRESDLQLPGTRSAFSRSHDSVMRVYDAAGNVIETHEHAGDFREW